MKIYQVKIIKSNGFNPYYNPDDIEIRKEIYFSTIEKSQKHLSDLGFVLSPTLISCGDKVIRVCENLEEADSLLNKIKSATTLQNIFTIDSPFSKNTWVLPDSILNGNFSIYKGLYAFINEIEVL